MMARTAAAATAPAAAARSGPSRTPAPGAAVARGSPTAPSPAPTPTSTIPSTAWPKTNTRMARSLDLGLFESHRPGDAIPSERSLCAQRGVSRPTLRAAVDELVAAGLLVREHGCGMFVAPEKITQELVSRRQVMTVPQASPLPHRLSAHPRPRGRGRRRPARTPPRHREAVRACVRAGRDSVPAVPPRPDGTGLRLPGRWAGW